MDIPSLSVAMSQANVIDQYSVAMLSKTLDTVEESGAMMIQMMEQSVNPHLGQNIDITV
ncbi:MAG: YjfB family protein [Lachnospiraceae bacterium]|nr:YjfB family protein [Lachnospiraceae bacterium]